MPYINIGRDRVYTEIHGEGEDVLMVGGVGGSTSLWDAQIKPLACRYRLIMHDPRGCGQSVSAGTVLDAKEMADDLVRVMDALKIEKAHIVGHSTGGAVGQHIALTFPERLDKLIMSSSWCGPDPYLTHLFETRRQILQSCGPQAYLFVSTILAAPSWHFYPRFGSADQFYDARMGAFPEIDIELRRIAAVMSHDLRDSVHRIKADTLVIAAEDDQVTPPALSQELARRIPGAQFVMLPKGGHYCPVTAGEDYSRRVLEFLDADRKLVGIPTKLRRSG